MQNEDVRWSAVIPENQGIFVDHTGSRHSYFPTILTSVTSSLCIPPSVEWCERIPVTQDGKYSIGIGDVPEIVNPDICPARTDNDRCNACGVFTSKMGVDNAVPPYCIVKTPIDLRQRPKMGQCLDRDSHEAALRAVFERENN